ncbi:MAG: hypothetical protein ACI9TH_004159 [Kiritimatiellia bacterium]|jgi:hypothetical protein
MTKKRSTLRTAFQLDQAFIDRFRINLIMSLILTYLPHVGWLATPVLFLLSPFIALEHLIGLGFTTVVLGYVGALLVMCFVGAQRQLARYIGFLVVLLGNIALAVYAARYVYI